MSIISTILYIVLLISINLLFKKKKKTNAQESFTYFQNVFLNSFESSFPESTTKLNYKNRLTWMPKSLIKCIERKPSLYKLSIMQSTEYNTNNYK